MSVLGATASPGAGQPLAYRSAVLHACHPHGSATLRDHIAISDCTVQQGRPELASRPLDGYESESRRAEQHAARLQADGTGRSPVPRGASGR